MDSASIVAIVTASVSGAVLIAQLFFSRLNKKDEIYVSANKDLIGQKLAAHKKIEIALSKFSVYQIVSTINRTVCTVKKDMNIHNGKNVYIHETLSDSKSIIKFNNELVEFSDAYYIGESLRSKLDEFRSLLLTIKEIYVTEPSLNKKVCSYLFGGSILDFCNELIKEVRKLYIERNYLDFGKRWWWSKKIESCKRRREIARLRKKYRNPIKAIHEILTEKSFPNTEKMLEICANNKVEMKRIKGIIERAEVYKKCTAKCTETTCEYKI